MRPLKIGIILSYKKSEMKKDELLPINSRKMKWLGLAKNPDYRNYVIKRDDKKWVPVDVAINLYIEYNYPDVIVDYISPDEISLSRLKKSDIVFLVSYDLLEAFHLTSKQKFRKFKHVLENSDNVYPPYDYQKFINNKCTYYKYLKEYNIPVAPTFCIYDLQNFKKNPEQYIDNLLKSVPWDSFILKPVYGQESFGFAKFLDKNSNMTKRKLKNYFKKNGSKYKGLIVQKYINGFDKKNIEVRTYFINGVYLYSMVTSGLTHTYTMREGRSVQEGGKFKILDKNWNYIMKLAQTVMDILPKFDLPPGMQNSIITRIDIGEGLENVPFNYFVNEVEFVPSFFIEKHREPVVQNIGESLIKLAKVYQTYKLNGELPIKTIF